MARREPVGGRELDVDIEDYRGVAAGFAGVQWADDHPLPAPRGPRPERGLAEDWAMLLAVYEAGIAAALLYRRDIVKLEAFMKGYLRGVRFVRPSEPSGPAR